MILFCDTSALIKLYIVEDGSDAIKTQLSSAEAVAVCRISQSPIFFACFDTRLNKAAKLLGMLCS